MTLTGTALDGLRLVTLAPNLPGPVAAARLRRLGMSVTKVEAPAEIPQRTTRPAGMPTCTRASGSGSSI